MISSKSLFSTFLRNIFTKSDTTDLLRIVFPKSLPPFSLDFLVSFVRQRRGSFGGNAKNSIEGLIRSFVPSVLRHFALWLLLLFLALKTNCSVLRNQEECVLRSNLTPFLEFSLNFCGFSTQIFSVLLLFFLYLKKTAFRLSFLLVSIFRDVKNSKIVWSFSKQDADHKLSRHYT